MAAAGETGLSDAYLETVRGLKLAGAAVGAGVLAIVALMELKPF
jgi:hypothetical protein